MYGPECHLSVWLLFSALSLLPVDLGDILRSPDNVPIFYYRPYIGFVQVNKGNFVKVLESFMNNSYKIIGFLSSDSGMVMELQLVINLYP